MSSSKSKKQKQTALSHEDKDIPATVIAASTKNGQSTSRGSSRKNSPVATSPAANSDEITQILSLFLRECWKWGVVAPEIDEMAAQLSARFSAVLKPVFSESGTLSILNSDGQVLKMKQNRQRGEPGAPVSQEDSGATQQSAMDAERLRMLSSAYDMLIQEFIDTNGVLGVVSAVQSRSATLYDGLLWTQAAVLLGTLGSCIMLMLTWPETIAACLASIVISFIQTNILPWTRFGFLFHIIAVLTSAVACFALKAVSADADTVSSVRIIVAGTIMWLPGLTSVTAIYELSCGKRASALDRLAGILLQLIEFMIGFALVNAAEQALFDTTVLHTLTTGTNHEWPLQIIAIVISLVSYFVCFKNRWSLAGFVATFIPSIWCFLEFYGLFSALPTFLITIINTFVVGVSGQIYASLAGDVPVFVEWCAVLFYTPGVTALLAARHFASGDTLLGTQSLAAVLAGSLAATIGLRIAGAIFGAKKHLMHL